MNYVFQHASFLRHPAGRPHVAVEPSFYSVNLVTEMDSGSAEGGRIKGSFFKSHGTVHNKLASNFFTAEDQKKSREIYMRLRGLPTGIRAGCCTSNSVVMVGRAD